MQQELNDLTYDFEKGELTAAGSKVVLSWLQAGGNYGCPVCDSRDWFVVPTFGVILNARVIRGTMQMEPTAAGSRVVQVRCDHCRQVLLYNAVDIFPPRIAN